VGSEEVCKNRRFKEDPKSHNKQYLKYPRYNRKSPFIPGFRKSLSTDTNVEMTQMLEEEF
jgi:hypothetical protein